ncbi:unnamed protein product [Mucor hiemalis]
MTTNLEIIGAGLGRTGTLSLRNALNQLGYKTHHMYDVILDSTQVPEIFEEAYKNPHDPVDWERAYQGYTAAVDWPTTAFFDKLYDLHPDAKVILTVRDPQDWVRSVSGTIHEWPNVDETWPSNILRARKMARVIVRDGELGGPITPDREQELFDKFVNHTEHIKSIVKPENLLVFNLGEDGWEKLCSFLGKEVPKGLPYPHDNKGKNFAKLLLEIKDISSTKDLSVGK